MWINWKFSGMLFLWLGSLSLWGQTGYRIIRVGGLTSNLPFPCTGGTFCEGEYDAQWVRVGFLDGIVDNVAITYFGEKLDHEPVRSNPITLSQAIKLHSLQSGFSAPIFIRAEDRVGNVYGIADVANDIVYTTRGINATDTVSKVVYVSADAPVLDVTDRSKLINDSGSLLQAARAARPYVSLPVEANEEKDAVPSSPRALSHDEAAEGMAERSDTVIGSGRMVLSLIDQVSYWYEIDKDHPDAISKSEELRAMYPKYLEAWRDLIFYANANKSLLHVHDYDPIPLSQNKEVSSKMRQLKAMGFEE